MTETEAATELARLADEVARHSVAYYEKDAPVISDVEYDALLLRNAASEARLPHLIRTDSPSLTSGTARAPHFRKGRHARPVPAPHNPCSDEDVAQFIGLGRRCPVGKDSWL